MDESSAGVCQGVWLWSTALRITSSLRMQALRAHHQVTVLEQGAIFEGKRYRSLSEIARKITGSRWSGPLFFGLNKRSQEEHRGGAR